MTHWPDDLDERAIDAAAKALREHEQGNKRLNPWQSLPASRQAPWRTKATVALRAAALATSIPLLQCAEQTDEQKP